MQTPDILGEAPIENLFLKYYIPALTSILSSTLHQIINGIILGQQVGKEGLASVGLFGPIVIVFIALSLPIMIGGGILIGRNVGAKNYAGTQEIFQFATTLALVLGGIIALSAPFIIKPIAHFLAGTENEIIVKNVSDYMFWQLIVMPFFFLRMFWGNFLSNDSSPTHSRNASLIAVGLNIFLDILLVVVFRWGVQGASIATAISIFTGTLYLFICIKKGVNHFGFNDFKLTLKLAEWKELLNFGLPSFASEISFSSGLLLISHSVIPYGPLAVSAFGLVNYLSFIFIRLFTAAMIATLPILSFNIGARLPNRVLETFKFSMLFTIILGLIITVLGFTVPHLFMKLFSDDKIDEFKLIAEKAIAFYFILFIAAGPNYILGAYLQSIGKSTIATIINILKGFVLIALLLFFLPKYLNMGLNGIWLSRSFAEILTLLMIGFYTFYNRKKYFSENAILKTF